MVNPSEFCVSGNALWELERSRAAGLLGNSPQVLLRNLWTEPIRIDIHSKIHQRWQKKGHRTKMGWNVFFFFSPSSWNGNAPFLDKPNRFGGGQNMKSALKIWGQHLPLPSSAWLSHFRCSADKIWNEQFPKSGQLLGGLEAQKLVELCIADMYTPWQCNICKISLHPHSHSIHSLTPHRDKFSRKMQFVYLTKNHRFSSIVTGRWAFERLRRWSCVYREWTRKLPVKLVLAHVNF